MRFPATNFLISFFTNRSLIAAIPFSISVERMAFKSNSYTIQRWPPGEWIVGYFNGK